MADMVTASLHDSIGVMIRNHGPFLVGQSIKEVFDRTVALRDVCELYYEMALIGKPSII